MLPSQPLVKTGEVKMLVAERNKQDDLHFRVCALSRDGKTLATAAEKAGAKVEVSLWDFDNGKRHSASSLDGSVNPKPRRPCRPGMP
jgi:WD40 repeat protein